MVWGFADLGRLPGRQVGRDEEPGDVLREIREAEVI